MKTTSGYCQLVCSHCRDPLHTWETYFDYDERVCSTCHHNAQIDHQPLPCPFKAPRSRKFREKPPKPNTVTTVGQTCTVGTMEWSNWQNGGVAK